MYAELRHNIRCNNINAVNDAWANVWPLFFSTNKVITCKILLKSLKFIDFYQTLYARLSLYAQHVLLHSHDAIKGALNKRLVSLRGEANRHFAADLLTEKANRCGR